MFKCISEPLFHYCAVVSFFQQATDAFNDERVFR